MECKIYDFNTLKNYRYADIFAWYKEKWIFCKHRARTSWETPGGHIEQEESPLDAAKRELFEEIGAISFDIEPLCDCWVQGGLNGVEQEANGQVFFANIHVLDKTPLNELKSICLLDGLPDELTYPEYTNMIFPIAVEKLHSFLKPQITEQFSVPGAGGIIVTKFDDAEHILLQERCKPDSPKEHGLLEIPAGKVRAFECIFDTLKREIKEETGLNVTKILGENLSSIYEGHSYKVINFMPFSCSQNIEGTYPIMVFVFICYAEGNLLPFSNESRNYKWVSAEEVESLLNKNPELFYPMHIDTLRKYVSISRT